MLSILMTIGLGAALSNQPVDALDLARYSGTWHEIARKPMYFERQCVRGVTATYVPRADGTVTVRNACTTAAGKSISVEGLARRAGAAPAELQVRFAPAWLAWLPFVWADYWVIARDPQYRWALVGEPSRRYLWVLARAPALDNDTLAGILAQARRMGYRTDDLVYPAP